jgi:hypothetical protein
MTGDDQVRFCGACEKHVYNLSAMTRDEAERLLVEREGRLCVRFYQREDGTVLTADCPVGVRRRRRRRVAYGLAGAGMMAATAAFAAGSAVQGEPSRQGTGAYARPLQGKPSLPETPTPAITGSVALPEPPPREMMGGFPAPPTTARPARPRVNVKH